MNLSISFEVFPPKTEEGLTKLATTTTRLATVDPIYVSVTYGAGGSSRDRSMDAIRAVASAGVDVAGHLTCVGQSRDEIDEVVDDYVAMGVEHVVALRGDPPEGVDAPYSPHPDGYQRTAELVAAITRRTDADVSVSAYPEVHPQSPDLDHDLDVLQAKIDAGATRAITQMFFDNRDFVRYLEQVRERGIDVPIVPGIFPIHSIEKVSRFASSCGATIPDRIREVFDRVGDGSAEAHELAADLAAAQISELVEHGVDHVHLYTLNRADLALAVCDRLGVNGSVYA